MILLTKDRVFPRPFTRGRDLSPPYGWGGEALMAEGLRMGDLTLIDYIIN